MIAVPAGKNRGYYRPDIDGLRAVAVLAVVLYHIRESILPGGFAGVDVFFVISGYLITGNLFRGMSKGTFTFKDFYRRRLLRILPPLIVVVFATVIAGSFIMLPADLIDMSRSALASLLSVANVYFLFFLDTSYFAADASVHPLLHIWSLGVEEQFYLIWPFLLLLFVKPIAQGGGVGRLAAMTLLLGIASFALAELTVRDHPMFAYYMLPTRAGQLMAGALVFFMTQTGKFDLPNWLREIVALFGLIAVMASLWMVDGTLPYPGISSLPVTLGTAAIIWAGTTTARRPVINNLLGLTPFVWIGLLSYSFYLWHWPVFAYWKYLYGEFHLLSGVIALGVTIGLSWLTYRFVETRFRKVDVTFPKVFNRTFVVPTTAVALAALGLQLTNGFGFHALTTYPKELQNLSANLTKERPGYICQRPDLRAVDIESPRCDINANGTQDPRALLWGDSNAAHYVGMLGALGSQYGFSFKNLAHSSCPPFVEGAEFHTASTKTSMCKRSSQLVVDVIDDFDVVILSASWPGSVLGNDEGQRRLEKTVDWLRSKDIKVIILGKAPIIPGADPACGTKSLKVPFLDCISNARVQSDRFQSPNEFLKSVAETRAGVEYFDITQYFCEGTDCTGYLDDTFAYYDSGHLAHDGSWRLGEKISLEGLPSAFASLPQFSPGPRLSVAALRTQTENVGRNRFSALTDPTHLINQGELRTNGGLEWKGSGSGVVEDGAFILNDAETDRLRILETDFVPADILSIPPTDAKVNVVARVKYDARRTNTPVITVIGRDARDQDLARWDFMAFPQTQDVYYKKLANSFNTLIIYDETEIIVTLAIEEIDPNRPLNFRLPAAASDGSPSYSSEGVGTVAIRSVELFIEQ